MTSRLPQETFEQWQIFVMVGWWELQHGFDFVDERLDIIWMLTQSEYRKHEELGQPCVSSGL